MTTQVTMFFCVCIALTIPLLVMSTFNQEEMNENLLSGLTRFQGFHHANQQPIQSLNNDDASSDDDHFVLKKAADFDQILKPCNRMPASGRGQEYADCVRSRMLLMGRRKRRNIY